MAWTTSNMCTYYAYLMGTNGVKPSTDAFSVALFTNSVTPAQSTTAAVNEYHGSGSTWASTSGVECSYASATPTTPIALTGGLAVTWGQNPNSAGTNYAGLYSTGSPQWTSATFNSGNSSVPFGCLVYDTTVSSTIISWNYFGNASGVPVTAGTFTITWNSELIAAIQCGTN